MRRSWLRGALGLAVLLPLLLLAATYGMSCGDGSVGDRKAGERRTEA